MHNIEPFYRWETLYKASEDEQSPFFEVQPNYLEYEHDIYGYYIHPDWDFIGSETLYLKILFTDYKKQFTIIELMGEWNDTLHNDVMYLKRNVVDHLVAKGINQFILIGENVLNFHGSDDCYYEEWFEDVEEGWIAAINFRDFVRFEWSKYQIDSYIVTGGELDDMSEWRTLNPYQLQKNVLAIISRRLN